MQICCCMIFVCGMPYSVSLVWRNICCIIKILRKVLGKKESHILDSELCVCDKKLVTDFEDKFTVKINKNLWGVV